MDLMTVTGPVARQDLGIILPHEHMFIDIRNQFVEYTDPEKHALSHQPVCISNIGVLRMNPYAVKDNLVLDDLDSAVEEANLFGKLGGRTIVDCTSIGILRDPVRLRALSQHTGLNIVAGCGYYTYDTHPAAMDGWPMEKISDEMLSDVLVGIDGTDIRAGIYGEIGTSDTIRPNEKKNLLAAARAYRQQPLEIQVHTYPWARAGLEAAHTLMDAGVDPKRIVICHIDIEFDMDYLTKLLKLGLNVEFDNFGKEFFILKQDRRFAGGIFARDIERVQVISKLLDLGFEKQILITNDVCLKVMLRRYGGYGYDHILRSIVPMMREEGISEETIKRFLQENPAKVLCG